MTCLESLIADHIRELTGAEFKIAAYVYRLLQSQEQVQSEIGELAEATGVSRRRAQSALKSLVQKGILKVDSTPKQGTCCWLPAAMKVKRDQSKPATNKRDSSTRRPPQPTNGNPPVTPPSLMAQHEDRVAPVRPSRCRTDGANRQSDLFERIQVWKRV